VYEYRLIIVASVVYEIAPAIQSVKIMAGGGMIASFESL